jgi:hypothetical protein
VQEPIEMRNRAAASASAKGVEDNGGANPISGISVVEADSIESAIAMAKPCPHLAIGGTIEIAPAMMDM